MALSECGLTTNSKGRELKEHGTPMFPVACYNDNLAEAEIPWHWHDELELIAVEVGTASISVGGESYTIEQGNACFINAGALHGGWAVGDGDCVLRSMAFHPRLVGGSIDSIFWQGYLQPLISDPACRCVRFDRDIPWNAEAIQAIENAWQICVAEQAGFEFQARAVLSQLVYLLASHRFAPPQSPPQCTPEKALRSGERIKAMLQYIEEHFDEELSTAQIARSATLSESECLRCFRDMIGTTPIQYLRQLRIQKAAELLAKTDRRIADIGALCGFQEMSYFAKIFREMKGRTPSEYRKRKKSPSEKT